VSARGATSKENDRRKADSFSAFVAELQDRRCHFVDLRQCRQAAVDGHSRDPRRLGAKEIAGGIDGVRADVVQRATAVVRGRGN
jgi:hypothetical protein